MPDLIGGLLPANFAVLALAHFVALLSPGPDFFLIIGHAARGRFRGAAFLCLGIAAGHAAYIALAVAGWSGIRQYPKVYFVMELAGALYLGWLGILLLRSGLGGIRRLKGRIAAGGQEPAQNMEDSPQSGSGTEVADRYRGAPGTGRQLAVGLATALLNPKNAVFYLTLMTVIIGPAAPLTQQAGAGIWMLLVGLGWDLAVAAFLGSYALRRASGGKIPCVEAFSGAAML